MVFLGLGFYFRTSTSYKILIYLECKIAAVIFYLPQSMAQILVHAPPFPGCSSYLMPGLHFFPSTPLIWDARLLQWWSEEKDASASWTEWCSLFHLCEDINIFTHQGTLQRGYMEGKEMIISERLNGLIIWFSATSSCLDPQEVLHEAAKENIQSSAVNPPPPLSLLSISLLHAKRSR